MNVFQAATVAALISLTAGCVGITGKAYDAQPGAWALRDRIVINGALMEFTETQAERSFVILHEAGHIALDHLKFAAILRDETKQQYEGDADYFALQGMRLAGLDPCDGARFLQRLTSHIRAQPADKARAQHLSEICADVIDF